MKQKLLLLFVAAVLFCFSADAQNRTIAGKVTGADDGLPIPGASVKIKGTTTGVQTDVNGNYAISAPGSAVLIFSSLGYNLVERTVGSQSVINVSLASSTNNLNQVVVVAYGTQKKEAITGSIATIGTADIEKRTVTNATQLLQGSSPGIATTSGNGQPGSGTTIRLRGFGSFAASSSPLIILDGSQYDGSIGDINVSDIDNISILKDASSSSLYGARAANGVIIITTKRGKNLGAGTINASVNQGYTERGTPEYDRLDAYGYYPAYWQAIKNNLMFSATPAQTDAVASQNATNTVATNLIYNPFNVPNNAIVGIDGKLNPNASLLYDDFDWYAPLQRTGKRTDVNTSFSGKTDKADYYVSLGYLNDNGYILKSDLKRFNGRVNVNGQVKPWLKTGLNLSASFTDLNNAQDAAAGSATSIINPFNFARGIGPIYPVFARDAAGNTILNPATGEIYYDYGQHPGSVNRPTGASPGRNVVYETILNDNLARRNNIGGRTYFEVKFLKDFTFIPAINIDIRNNVSNTYQNPTVGDGASLGGRGSNTSTTIKSYTLNQLLNYNKTFGNHNIAATIGHENYDYTYRNFSGSKTSLILQGNTEFGNFVTPQNVGGYRDAETIESFLSRATYNYKEKYYLEGSLRRDGSSRFSPQNRWGTFFSAGASWSIVKEDFMKNVSWVNDLRLKASYGEVGNNRILNTDATDSYYDYQAFYDIGWNNGTEPGALLLTVATPDLQWETSKTLNLGLSFGLFKGRLNGELEYFKRGSDKLLFSVPRPLSNAVTSVLQNIGSMENRGWELQLGGDVLRAKDFKWNLVTNWTIFKNEITKLPVETPTIVSGTKRREVGKDFYAFWLRQYAGVDPNDGSALYIPDNGTAAANIRTVNGVQYVTNQTFAKFDYSGTAIPDLMGSFTNTFSFKDLSLSFLVNYQIGGKFYDSNYQGLMSLSYGSALHADAANAWTTTNKGSQIPRLDIGNTTNINATSTRWLIDASYISFSNVNLSYRLPKTLLSKFDASNLRIFATAENLATISKRKGLDPREAFDGVNNTTYLAPRIYSFGLSLSL